MWTSHATKNAFFLEAILGVMSTILSMSEKSRWFSNPECSYQRKLCVKLSLIQFYSNEYWAQRKCSNHQFAFKALWVSFHTYLERSSFHYTVHKMVCIRRIRTLNIGYFWSNLCNPCHGHIGHPTAWPFDTLTVMPTLLLSERETKKSVKWNQMCSKGHRNRELDENAHVLLFVYLCVFVFVVVFAFIWTHSATN